MSYSEDKREAQKYLLFHHLLLLHTILVLYNFYLISQFLSWLNFWIYHQMIFGLFCLAKLCSKSFWEYFSVSNILDILSHTLSRCMIDFLVIILSGKFPFLLLMTFFWDTPLFSNVCSIVLLSSIDHLHCIFNVWIYLPSLHTQDPCSFCHNLLC